jgi:hypothetical protein
MRASSTLQTPTTTVGGYYTWLPWADRNGDHFAQRDEILLSEGVSTEQRGLHNPTAPPRSTRSTPTNANNHASHPASTTSWRKRSGAAIPAAHRHCGYIRPSPPRLTTSTGVVSGGWLSAEGSLTRMHRQRRRHSQNRPTTTSATTGSSSRLQAALRRWMARVAFATDWKEYTTAPAPSGRLAPTWPDQTACPRSGRGSAFGGIVAQVVRSQINTFFNATWQLSAALYQLGAARVAGALFGRQPGRDRPERGRG